MHTGPIPCPLDEKLIIWYCAYVMINSTQPKSQSVNRPPTPSKPLPYTRASHGDRLVLFILTLACNAHIADQCKK